MKPLAAAVPLALLLPLVLVDAAFACEDHADTTASNQIQSRPSPDSRPPPDARPPLARPLQVLMAGEQGPAQAWRKTMAAKVEKKTPKADTVLTAPTSRPLAR